MSANFGLMLSEWVSLGSSDCLTEREMDYHLCNSIRAANITELGELKKKIKELEDEKATLTEVTKNVQESLDLNCRKLETERGSANEVELQKEIKKLNDELNELTETTMNVQKILISNCIEQKLFEGQVFIPRDSTRKNFKAVLKLLHSHFKGDVTISIFFLPNNDTMRFSRKVTLEGHENGPVIEMYYIF